MNILTSDAFSAKGEKDAVPIWRDGAAGRELQKSMVEVCCKRLFEFGGLDQCIINGRAVFANGAAWAAFARLVGPPHFHFDAVMERAFGMKNVWSDSVKLLHRSGIVLQSSLSGHTHAQSKCPCSPSSPPRSPSSLKSMLLLVLLGCQ